MPEALTGTPRILNKIVDGFVGNSSGGTLAFLPGKQGQGWDIIPAQAGTRSMFRWRGSIDLGGLEREALTFFMQSAQVTESNTLYASGATITIVDMFSKIEITDADLNLPTQFQPSGGGLELPYCAGYNDSVQDMEQVLWGRIRGFYHDAGWSAANLQQPFFNNIWGEGIGTSASRIHLTRYVITLDDESGVVVPPACFQCVGTAIEEPDLEYIMRLRRDYELAQG